MIWCVEDETSIRDIEVYSLESTGFEARGFEDGISFWNAIQNLNNLMDTMNLSLPEAMDALRVSKNLRPIIREKMETHSS